MARAVVDQWLVVDRGSDLIKAIGRASVFESEFRSIPMSTYQKTEPRITDMGVDVTPKGGTYAEDTSSGDEITLTARKFTKAYRLAEEDSDDQTTVSVLDAKKDSWGRSFAVMVDNASIGVTAAENGTTVPFTSIYNALASADAGVGYTAGANLTSSTVAAFTANSSAAPGYTLLSNLAGLVESGNFFDAGSIFILHPSIKTMLRNMLDNTGKPIFYEAPAGSNISDSLFGYRVRWTNGAKTSATATFNPNGAGGAKGAAGNPLAIFLNPSLALAGKRSGPESIVIPGRDGLSALTDEDILKMRARRAFRLGMPQAAAILELTLS